MAKRKRRTRDHARQTRGNGGPAVQARDAFDKLTLVLTVVGVSVFAIFTGYLVGQYAVRWVAAPLVVTQRAADPGTRVVDDAAPSQSPVVLAPTSNHSAGQGASRTSAATVAQAPAAGSASPASSHASSAPAAGSVSSGPANRSTAAGAPAIAAVQSGQPNSAPRASGAESGSSDGQTQAQAQAQAAIYRVHVGRFATRQDALREAEALKTGDPAVPDAWVLFDSASGEYRVQAGAFSNRQRAQDFANQLVALGHDAYIAP